VLLLLDSGKFGEVASCAAQSRCRPGFEFDAGNRVDLANHRHTWMQRRRFGALPMRTASIEKQRPLHPYRNGRIVRSYTKFLPWLLYIPKILSELMTDGIA
jgi:hypothetical protein